MTSSVTPISAARGFSALPADAHLTITPNNLGAGRQRMGEAIAKAGLSSDARALWLAYPNLQSASERLVDLIGSEWPSRTVVGASAAFQAVLTAITKVNEGVQHGEATRDFIVANFLQGLLSVTDDLAGVVAWGFHKDKAVEQFDPATMAFDAWAKSGSFSEVRFFFAERTSPSELEGTRLKVLCAVASVKDVGVATRYKR